MKHFIRVDFPVDAAGTQPDSAFTSVEDDLFEVTAFLHTVANCMPSGTTITLLKTLELDASTAKFFKAEVTRLKETLQPRLPDPTVRKFRIYTRSPDVSAALYARINKNPALKPFVVWQSTSWWYEGTPPSKICDLGSGVAVISLDPDHQHYVNADGEPVAYLEWATFP